MTISLDSLTSPNTVTIFAQAPGVPFAAFVLNLAAVPQAGRVRLDLAETEDVKRSYEVSRNPREPLVGQNKLRNPDTLSITGRLSAHPLFSPLQSAGVARLDKRELDKLRDLFDRDTPLFIVTPERPYRNMIGKELHERYDDTTGDGVLLTLVFEEELQAIPGQTESVLDLDQLGIGAGSTSDLGPQTPADAADPGGLG